MISSSLRVPRDGRVMARAFRGILVGMSREAGMTNWIGCDLFPLIRWNTFARRLQFPMMTSSSRGRFVHSFAASACVPLQMRQWSMERRFTTEPHSVQLSLAPIG